jgi:hypothetical protein
VLRSRDAQAPDATSGVTDAAADAGGVRARDASAELDAGGSSLLRDAGYPPTDARTDPACEPQEERCDGRDNDCNGAVDEGSACGADCVGLLLGGRSAMFCGGDGEPHAGAVARCAAQGMRPVVIESAADTAAIVAAAAPLHAQLSRIDEEQPAVWIDATDSALEGTWRWGDGGPIFWVGNASGDAVNGAYVAWGSGKPNDNANGAGEDCGVVNVGDGPDELGRWNDHICAGLRAVLCREPAATP